LLVLEGAAPLDPPKAVENAEERGRVRKALLKMKKRSTKILILRYSGFSYTEIAGAIGVSASSVGTLLARAEREFERHYRALD
jgi:RNA polymerase sigma factor (sigma-70 family)